MAAKYLYDALQAAFDQRAEEIKQERLAKLKKQVDASADRLERDQHFRDEIAKRNEEYRRAQDQFQRFLNQRGEALRIEKENAERLEAERRYNENYAEKERHRDNQMQFEEFWRTFAPSQGLPYP